MAADASGASPLVSGPIVTVGPPVRGLLVTRVMTGRLVRRVVWTVTAIALTAGPASAQDHETPCELSAIADTVFSGIAGSPVRRPVRIDGESPVDMRVIPITVTRDYRGAAKSTLYVRLDLLGVVLEPGAEYLVYGDWDGATGAVTGERSSGTRAHTASAPDVLHAVSIPVRTEDASDDLAFLESTLVSPAGGTIVGRLEIGRAPHDIDRVPASGIPVRVLDRDNRLIREVETREDGRFVVPDVPVGLAVLEPLVPDGLWVRPGGVVVVASGCSRLHMLATFNGRIRGRVFHEGPGPVRVDLIPVGDARAVDGKEHRTVESAGSGEFEFAGVPEGTYYVGVNLRQQPHDTLPYHPTYYPGTTRSELAIPIAVGRGTVHDRIDFGLGSPLRPGQLDVQLPFDRASRATVCVWDTGLPVGQASGVLRESPDRPIAFRVFEGRPYRVAAHVDGPSGHTQSEIVEFVAVGGSQSIRLSTNRRAPALDPNDVCADFDSRTRPSSP